MKSIYFILTLFLCFDLAAQDYRWNKSTGGTGTENSTSIVSASNGAVYVVGFFENTVDFDPNTTIVNVTSQGGKDIFIQKLDGNGNLLWVKTMGGTSDDQATAVALDTNGNVYLTGSFQGTVDFDPSATVLNKTAVGQEDIFIQKLDPNGNLIWVHSMGSGGQDEGTALTVTNKGYLHINGNFSSQVDFDPSTANTTLSSNGLTDYFVLKMELNGNFVWVRSMGNTSNNDVITLATDNNGNVYSAGIFISTIDLDPALGTTVLFNTNGSYDIFIQKLDENGNFVWANSIGSADFDFVEAITIDDNDNIYVSGQFRGPIDLDPGSGIFTVNTIGGSDAFLQKLDTNGVFIWGKSWGSIGVDFGMALHVDPSGNVYTTGCFSDTIDLDPGTGVAGANSNGDFDVFIQKLDNNGDFLWARTMGGVDRDFGTGITVDANDNVYTTGYFKATVDFNPNMATDFFTSNGDFDCFVHKLSQKGFIHVPVLEPTSLEVYPNPSTGQVFINLATTTTAQVTLLDVQGRIVIPSQAITTLPFLLKADNLPTGIYYISVTTATTSYVTKWVKQ